MAEQEIAYGVKEPGVYDGVLYWVGSDGVAFHRFKDHYMRVKAQPYIDAFNANVSRGTSESS